MDGILRSGKCEMIESLWNIIVINSGFQPNINCYATALITASKIKDNNLANTLVDKFVFSMKAEFICEMNYDRCWNQILITYSNLCQYDKMWQQYLEMRQYVKPNAFTFSILSNVKNKYYQLNALKEAKKYIKKWNNLSHKELKGFYRTAQCVMDNELMNILHPILQTKQENVDVLAELSYDDNENKECFDNFYKYEDSNILKKVDDLIEESNHKIDIGQHSEISPTLSYRLISYHSEKKALAFALNKGASNISIKLSLRMCMDCHSFFCKVSQLYSKKNIIIIDPKIKHHFKNGKCSCSCP